MRVAVVFDTPYSGWSHLDHERQMESEVAAWKVDEPEMEYQIGHALRERGHQVRLLGVQDDFHHLVGCLDGWGPDLVFNGAEAFSGNESLEYLLPGLLEVQGYRAGIAQASVVQDVASLAERVAFIHDRFGQGAIAEEFVDGRELYVSVIGNDAGVEILPIIEMVFDKTKTRPEEQIATQNAKWDESYRERKGIRNVLARPIAQSARARIEEACRIAYRALRLRDYARLDLRLAPDGAVWDFIQRIVDAAIARYERS